MRNLIYRLYESKLERALRAADLPKHIGVIVDGNRRWATKQGGKAKHGHLAGAQKIPQFLQWCDELGIKVVTIYLLSTDNLTGRSASELEALQKIIGGLATELADVGRYRIQLVGDREAIPDQLLGTLVKAQSRTKSIDGVHVNLAIAYGGRKEIADAMRSIVKTHAKAGKSLDALAEILTPELIAEHLYTSGQPDPDLLIRTSGEQRLSGFLLWQSANSEFYVAEALWPDFRRVDFLRALRDFQSRHRRFGK